MRISYEDLSKDSVSIYFTPGDSAKNINGMIINGMCGYSNSEQGRQRLEAECSNEIVANVYKVWGNIPTVVEPTPLVRPTPQPSETDLLKAKIAMLESSLAATQIYMNKKAGV